VVGGWTRPHNEEFHNLYASPSIVKVITSRNMRQTGHVERREISETFTKFWLENLKGRDHSEDLDVDGMIILEWILGK
jgi:hypothetical protein